MPSPIVTARNVRDRISRLLAEESAVLCVIQLCLGKTLILGFTVSIPGLRKASDPTTQLPFFALTLLSLPAG